MFIYCTPLWHKPIHFAKVKLSCPGIFAIFFSFKEQRVVPKSGMRAQSPVQYENVQPVFLHEMSLCTEWGKNSGSWEYATVFPFQVEHTHKQREENDKSKTMPDSFSQCCVCYDMAVALFPLLFPTFPTQTKFGSWNKIVVLCVIEPWAT